MNKRIKELESQCWEPRQYGPAWFNSTKFAELIVRECIDNVAVWEKDSRNHISYMLKQHFGVEE